LKPGDVPPRIDDVAPFKAVVVVECDVTPEWQAEISNWLVRGGCRYMLAWGQRCGDWDTSVDEAALAMSGVGEVPEKDFVMTTWHEDETLREAFRFSERFAFHPSLELGRTYLIHVAAEPRAIELLDLFRVAQEAP
jgi:hypothetical protein